MSAAQPPSVLEHSGSAGFSLDSDPAVVRESFADRGYVVFRRALPLEPIRRFLHQYERARRSRWFVYYSQSYQTAMRPDIDTFGHVVEAMQNASRLALFPKFTRELRACIYHRGISRALSMVTGADRHVSWQNMFFDRSTGTIEHQDSWYLDTDPPGGVVGVWVALEEIKPGAGAFFVSPCSHRLPKLDRKAYPDHAVYLQAMKEYVARHALPFAEQLLGEGDILIWHSFLIHGAFAQTEAAHSRRSLTSHFYPLGAKAKDTESGKAVSIYDHDHPKPTHNPDIFTAYRYSDYVYNALVYGKFIWDRLRRGKGFVDMRRGSHA